MSQFNLHKFFHEAALREQDDEEFDPQNPNQNNSNQMETDPNMAVQNAVPPNPQGQTPEQGAPAQQTKMIQGSSDHFSSVIGQAIDNIKFERATGNQNAGSIKIYTEKYQLPLIISWSNGKITVTTPQNGEVYPLS